MKRFIRKSILFIILISCLLFLFGRDYGFKDGASDYMAAIIDKHARLQRTVAPRLIFVGGSNLAFGINSKRIQDSIGLPVVNLGLHAALGLDFIINEIRSAAKAGDILILSIEYFMLLEGDYDLKVVTSENYPFAKQFYKKNTYQDFRNLFVKKLPENLRVNIRHLFSGGRSRKIVSATDAVYSRSSFDSFGDVTLHLSKPTPEKLGGKYKFIYRYWEGIDYLNDFADYARQNNIRLFFVYPNFPESEFDLNRETLLKYAADCESNLNIPILNKPADIAMPDSLFYNTIYHLNKTGRELKTEKMIRLLSQNILYKMAS